MECVVQRFALGQNCFLLPTSIRIYYEWLREIMLFIAVQKRNKLSKCRESIEMHLPND